MDERHDDRTSDEIRRDIEVARTDLRGTVDALERKLTIGQIVDEVWGRVGNRRSATSAASSVGDVFRDHPVPLALMGLGVAWLAVDKVTGSESDDANGHAVGMHGRAEGRVGPYRGDEARHASSGPTAMDKARDMASDATDKASALADKAKGVASDAKERFGPGGAGDSSEGWSGQDEGPGMTARAGEAVDRARDAASQTTKKAKRGFRSAMDEQPLALGAVAFGLGLASGLAAPSTSWEDSTMGRAADTVKDEAGSLAKEAAGDVKEVVADAANAAKEEAKHQSGTVKESVDAIATEAKETAKDRMDDKDLDSEGMKERVTRSGERTQERLSD
jgi:hypothetical protein